MSYKKNPLSGLHNLPIEIQERVQKLQEYKDIKPEKVLSTKERIIKNLNLNTNKMSIKIKYILKSNYK